MSHQKSQWNAGQRLLGAALVALFLMVVTSAYYANEVRLARRDTPSLIEAAWKRYGSSLELADLSLHRKAMLLSIEDTTFYRHHGVDLTTPGAGMTTLTQGLVKLLYFPKGFRPGLAKIRQTLIAQYAFDPLVPKDVQLHLFLNICYMGNQEGRSVYGYANAARVYFSKEFSAITDDEFLSLVAMHIGPNAFKPGTAANVERVRRIRRCLSGEYRPVDLLDVEYDGKRHGSLPEKALIGFLRLVTN